MLEGFAFWAGHKTGCQVADQAELESGWTEAEAVSDMEGALFVAVAAAEP